tara:strand:- start:8566 stop:8988 length:423 start_codon:yes stop_codon:yes gene_type:complete
MKVAYNGCYGGFSLSPLGLDLFASKKGITLTWYTRTRICEGPYTRLDEVPSSNGLCFYPFTKNLGPITSVIPDDELYYYPSFYESESRKDPDLIEVIEELGSKANGSSSKLTIKEIPEGVDFEITEYDGYEDVVPPRMSW